MKQFLKKFKKFRLTAIVEGCAGVVSVITSILILVFYQTNLAIEKQVGRKGVETVFVNGFDGEPINGMIFFLAALLVIIFGIVAAYGSYPYIFKKDEKLEPNRALAWFGVTCGGFALIEFVFVLLMIMKAGSRHTIGLVISGVFLILAAIVQLLMIIPTLMVKPEKE